MGRRRTSRECRGSTRLDVHAVHDDPLRVVYLLLVDDLSEPLHGLVSRRGVVDFLVLLRCGAVRLEDGGGPVAPDVADLRGVVGIVDDVADVLEREVLELLCGPVVQHEHLARGVALGFQAL